MTSTEEEGVENQISWAGLVCLESLVKQILRALTRFKSPCATSFMLSKLKALTFSEQKHLFSCYGHYLKFRGHQKQQGHPQKCRA